MSTVAHSADPTVVVIGCGGLGSPATLTLVRSGLPARLRLVDDDVVDVTNLHRQTLYDDGDVGRPKVDAARERLLREAERAGGAIAVDTVRARLRPDTAKDLLDGADLVVEGADNFATKFLAADAARLCGVPIVQAGAVRWAGWALLSAANSNDETPCMRCVFEDIPRDRVETCATAGVIGPVVGVLGACQAALAISAITRRGRAAGRLFHYDGLSGRLRRTDVRRRQDCPLCDGRITSLDPERYIAPECA